MHCTKNVRFHVLVAKMGPCSFPFCQATWQFYAEALCFTTHYSQVLIKWRLRLNFYGATLMPVFVMTAQKPRVQCSGVSSFILTEKKNNLNLSGTLSILVIQYNMIRYDTYDAIRYDMIQYITIQHLCLLEILLASAGSSPQEVNSQVRHRAAYMAHIHKRTLNIHEHEIYHVISSVTDHIQPYTDFRIKG